MGVIYILTSPSGKQYVGQHKTDNVEKRMETHVSGFESYMKKLEELKKLRRDNPDEKYEDIPIKGCIALYNAFAKHGVENFVCDVLHENVEFAKLNDLEDECIIRYNTLAPNGYNLRLNKGNIGVQTLSDETKKRFSEAAVLKNKKYLDKYRRYKEEMKGLPQYVVFYQDKDEYKGYKIMNHPKCSSKSFTSKHLPLETLKQNCLAFIAALEKTAYVKQERVLPKGVCKPKNRNGYMAYFKFDGKRYSNYFSNSSDAINLQNAIDWIKSRKEQLNSTQE